jgi:Fe-S cluster assembly protein SufD
VLEHGWPATRDEAWRYAPLAEITAALDTGARPGGAPTAAALDGLLAGLPPGPRVVVVDGRFRPELSTLPDGPGLELELGVPPGALGADAGLDAFAAANHAASPGTTRIRVRGERGGRGGRVERPGGARVTVHVVHLTLTGPAAHPRTEVTVEPGTDVELIETFRSAPGTGLTNATTTIDVGTRARVGHLRVLEGAPATAHVGSTGLVLHDGAELRAATLTSGPGAVRQRVTARLAGTGASVTLAGLCTPAAGAHHDTAVSVRHEASHATSRQRFVAVVPDGGRSSFTGHVAVAAGTAGTDADQQQRNLLLGPSARADSRPWLEIDADDVACTHGATVGRLDDDAVFYLRSRGFPRDVARSMLVAAFAHTALEGVLPPGPAGEWLATSTDAAVGTVLERAPGASR